MVRILFNQTRQLATLLLAILLVFYAQQGAIAAGSGKILQTQSSRLCEEIYEEMDFYYLDGLTGPLVIEPYIIFEKIGDVDSRSFNFGMSFILFNTWKDPRLVELLQKKGAYAEEVSSWLCDWTTNAVWLEQQKLFDPVLEFQNTVHSQTGTHRADWVEIFTDGTIRTRLKDTYNFITDFDLRKFPFDTQRLRLVLGTVFNTDTVIIKPDRKLDIYRDLELWKLKDDVGVAGFHLDVPEWTATAFDHYTRHVIKDNERRSELIIEIEMERYHVFYFLKIILPILLMFFICWSVLWIHPSEVQTSTNIAIVGFLSLITYNFMLSEELPKVNYITLIDIFLFTNYLFIGLALLLCCLANHAYLYAHENLNKYTVIFRNYGIFAYGSVLSVSAFLLW